MDKELIVFIPYDDPFHWVLAAESVSFYSQAYSRKRIIYLQTDTKRSLVQIAKRIFGYQSIEIKIRKTFRGSGILFEKKYLRSSKRNIQIECDELGRLKFEAGHQRYAYRDLILQTSSQSIEVRAHAKTIRKTLARMRAIECYISSQQFRQKDIIVVNGGFAFDRVIAEQLKNDNSVRIAEVGSTRNTIEFWDNAQSLSEATNKMNNLWKSSKLKTEELIEVVDEFIKSKEKIDAATGISWTRYMRNGNLPALNAEKKLAVFYSSSDIEFLEHPVDESYEWKTQQQSLSAVLELLDPNAWDVILRKHPTNGSSQSFESFSQWPSPQEFPNLSIVEGDSEVNSYDLARMADLVFHYNSSIGPELILRGLRNVATLGPTFWHELNQEGHIRTKRQLSARLSDYKLGNSYDSLLPWGLYSASYGKPFQLFSWTGKPNWSIDGLPVEETFSSWLWGAIRKNLSKFPNIYRNYKRIS